MSLETLSYAPDGKRLERISPSSLAYLSQRARNNCYDFVIRRFSKSGMTKAQLARRIGKRPEQINHIMANPGNWTIRTIAELLVGIADEEFIPSASALKGRAPHNRDQACLLDQQLEKASLLAEAADTGSSAESILLKVPA